MTSTRTLLVAAFAAGMLALPGIAQAAGGSADEKPTCPPGTVLQNGRCVRASSGVLPNAVMVSALTSALTVAENRPAISLGGTSRPSSSTTFSATGIEETRKA